jgi:hypothetical protein
VEREERGDRGGGIGAPAAHAGLRRDAFDEREAGATRQREVSRDETRGAQHEVVGSRGHQPSRARRRAGSHRSVFVPHAERESTRARLGDERVGERHRLEYGHDVVIAVRAAPAHVEPEVELGARLDRDAERARADSRGSARAGLGALAPAATAGGAR